MEHGCTLIGHRRIDPARLDYVKREMRREVLEAIDDGYRHFYCGMGEGADLLFASVVLALREAHHLTLEAALPYPNRATAPDPVFQELLQACDTVLIHAKAYIPRCFTIRNEYMVRQSSRLIAVFDGRERSGTGATIRYARVYGRDLRIISLEDGEGTEG